MPFLLALVLWLMIPSYGLAQWFQCPGTEGKIVNALLTNDSVYLAGTVNGIFRSFNHGGLWNASSKGIIGLFNVSALLERGNRMIAGLMWYNVSPIYITTNHGEEWRSTTLRNGSVSSLVQTSNSIFFINQLVNNCLIGQDVYRSQDEGETWDALPMNCSVGLTVINSELFTSYFNYITNSVDEGSSWHRRSYTPIFDGRIDFVTVMKGIDESIFIGTLDSGVYKYSLIDSMFERKSVGLPETIKVNALIQNGTTLLSGMEHGGVFQSTNQGELWTSFADDFPSDLSVFSLSVNNGLLLAGTNDGVWMHPFSDSIIFQSVSFEEGWNLVSLPLQTFVQTKKRVFSTTSSEAFQYDGKYRVAESLHVGNGYWLKSDSSHSVFAIGKKVLVDTFAVRKGWNIIGSISQSVFVDSLETIPPNLISSNFYGYSTVTGYAVSDSIVPGIGYWVKANDSGKVILR